MKSMFTIGEVGDMLDMSVEEVEQEINNGYLSYSFQNGKKKVTLYDLEKYMGAQQTQKITANYLSGDSK
jgi:hypothetical protein